MMKCLARVWTIEYQKLGFPPLEDSHFLEPDVVDEMVSGDVRSAMIHGPCHNHQAP
jgi:hypothetical protein